MNHYIRKAHFVYIQHIHKIACGSGIIGGLVFNAESNDQHRTINTATGTFAGLFAGYTSPIWLPFAGICGASYTVAKMYREITAN